jgi:hypothetical protein
MAGDLDLAVSFLERWEPDGPWLLTAIEPDSGRIETRRFDDPEPMRVWLARQQARRNIYFSVNRARPGVTGRASKKDIAQLLALHVDIDPPKTPVDDLAAAQAEIRSKLEQAQPPPSSIIASGNGFQGFWLLDEPVDIDDNDHSVEKLEAYNVGLARQLGADHCFNIDRVMRVPGTVNLPDAKKRALGRVPIAADLVFLDLDRRYRLDDFTSASTPNGKGHATNGNGNSAASPFDPGPWLSEVMRLGYDPKDPGRWQGDRSRAVFAVACGLVKKFWSDERIIAVLLDPNNQISAHVRDQKDPPGYARRQVLQAHRAAAGNGADHAADIVCQWVEPHPITSIPPRAWAYGHFLLFGSPSVIGAVDGGGKGALAVVIALSMITGRPLLGERVWRTGPVAVLTYEDDQTEWSRRIAAACVFYGLDYAQVIPSFFFLRRADNERIRLAAPSVAGAGVVFPDGDRIIAKLAEIGAALWVVDPFNHAHMLDDGNNNVMVAKTAGEVFRIARASGAAALALHHLRKGSTGEPDDLMGATALRATFRSARILARMSSDEAKKLDIPPAEAWRYSRIAGHKENYAPPPEMSTWYRLESQDLGNGAGIYPDGDNLQVLTLYDPPDVFDGLSRTTIAEIFNKFRQGPQPGEFYKPRRNASAWAGDVIIMTATKTAGEAEQILYIWGKKKVLLKDKYLSPATGRYRERVTVNEAQAAAILGPLYRPPGAAA